MATYQVDTEDGHSYQVETEDAGQGSKLEEAISPTGGKDNFVTSPHGLIRTGARQVVHGVGELLSPGNRMQGASDVIRGGMKVAAPAAILFAAANPVAAGLGLGAGVLGGKAVRAGVQAAGGGEGAQNLGEDVGGLAAGGAAAHFTPPNLSPAIGAGIRAAAPDVLKGGAQVAAGEALARAPGMEWPARIGLGYPGAKQMGRGMQTGFNAAKEAFNPPVAAPTRAIGPSPKWQGPSVNPPEGLQQGPLPQPTLPSGRVPGNVQPPTTPQSAAAQDTHVPGTTQAGEFKVSPPTPQGVPPQQQSPAGQSGPIAPTPKPIIPSSGQNPKGGAVSPGGTPTEQATEVIKPGTQPPGEPMLAPEPKSKELTVKSPYANHPAHERVDAGLATKIPNVIAHAKDEGYTLEDLKELHADATQAEDPAKQAAAFEEIKTLGKGAFDAAKKAGRPTNPSGSGYKGMSTYTLGKVIEAWGKD